MSPTKTSPTYNLGAIIRETGLKADTLRAWERRYDLPQPSRSAGRQRLYSQRDLETIKWLMAKQAEGLRISQAAQIWHQQIAEGADPLDERISIESNTLQLSLSGSNLAEFRSQWVAACTSFNEASAEQIITEAFSQFSPELVCLDILFAGLSEIGKAWYQGEVSVQQEHFASALVARRLSALIVGAPPPTRPERIVIAAPANEEHFLSALLITFLLRRRGWDVVYLGADVPLENFRTTIENLNPDMVLLTAHQLTTAASLQKMGDDLHGLPIKLAFGGLIFNRSPRLRNQIPGDFLGEELKEVSAKVEQILHYPPKKLSAHRPAPSPVLQRFREVQTSIDNQVDEQFALQPEIRTIYKKYFLQDMIAALELGDISFLSIDIDWIHTFLENFNIPQNTLLNFLRAYHQILADTLDTSASALPTWLQSEIQRLIEQSPEKG